MPTLAELGMQNFGGAMSESQRMQLKLFNEERTQVRVVKRDNRPVALNGLGCVRGDDVDGEHVVEGIVTASQLKELHDQVEDEPELVRASVVSHMRRLRGEVQKQLGWNEPMVATKLASADIKEWPEDAQKVARKYPGAPEAEFFRTAGRGIKPLIRVEEVAKLPSLAVEARSAQANGAKDIATALQSLLASVGPENISPTPAAVMPAPAGGPGGRMQVRTGGRPPAAGDDR